MAYAHERPSYCTIYDVLTLLFFMNKTGYDQFQAEMEGTKKLINRDWSITFSAKLFSKYHQFGKWASVSSCLVSKKDAGSADL